MGNCTSDPAPYLAEYYSLMEKEMDKKFNSLFNPENYMMAGIGGMGGHRHQHALEQVEREVARKGRPLLEKSFDHHDTKKNGVLDKEEASVFFSHVMDKQPRVAERLGKQALANTGSVVSWMALVGQAPKGAKDEISEKKSQLTREMNSQIAAYKRDKTARDAAAFKVMDTNGNGTLKKEEFLQAMLPGTRKNKEFLEALGFDQSKFEQLAR